MSREIFQVTFTAPCTVIMGNAPGGIVDYDSITTAEMDEGDMVFGYSIADEDAAILFTDEDQNDYMVLPVTDEKFDFDLKLEEPQVYQKFTVVMRIDEE